jgi:hypothetical protein
MSSFHARILAVASLGVFVAGVPASAYRGASQTATWAIAVLAGALLLPTLAAATDRSLLTDERRRWSLSRIQLYLWMALLLPTFWALVAIRIFAGAKEPAAVDLDPNLWLLLGINATSLVGSSLVLSRKRQLELLHERVGGGSGQPSDLVLGEEVGNSGVMDLGRVQMVFFTGVTLLIYVGAVIDAVASTPGAQVTFPPVSDSFVALLAISHGTYLANKLPDRPAPVTPALPGAVAEQGGIDRGA